MTGLGRFAAIAIACAMLVAGVVACGPTQAVPSEPTISSAPTQAVPSEPTSASVPTQAVSPEPTASPAATPAEATEEPVASVEETSIVIAIPEDPPSFNASVSDTGYDALVMELVMLGLADLDPDGNVIAELAADLPTLDNGGVVIDEDAGTMDVTWNLRQDIAWADGEPVTTDDVVFTYEAIIDPDTGLWVPGIDYVDSLEKIDDYTLVIHYNSIYPGYLLQFGGEQIVVWPEHYCDAEQGFTAWDCGRQPLSNGPYLLEEWVQGDHLTFVRNPGYFDVGKPAIDKILVRIVPDNSVAKTMLAEGDADLYMWATEPMVEDLKDNPQVRISQAPTSRWVMRLFPNQAANGSIDPAADPHPILSDVRVRQAIRMAIDVDTISQEIFSGYGQPVWTEFFRPPYTCDIPRPAYDPAGAADLLKEAGWVDRDGDGVRECHGCLNAEDGYPMKLEFMTYAEYGEALELAQQLMAEMLGKIGMQLDLVVTEGSVMWADYQSGGLEQNGNFDLNLWDDGYPGIDPTDFLWELYYSEAAQPDAGWNVERYMNPEFDALLDEAYTLDESARQELFCQMAEMLENDLPIILLFSTINADAHSARLQGIRSSVNDLVTWNAADWQLME